MAHILEATRPVGITTSLLERQVLAAYLLSESPWINLGAAGHEQIFSAVAQHRFRNKPQSANSIPQFYQEACTAAQTLLVLVQRWAHVLTRSPVPPDLPSTQLPLPEGQYIFRGYRLDPLLPQAPPYQPLPLASFTTCPVVAMRFACRAVHSVHFAGVIDPRTRRIFGGGTSGLRVVMIGRVSPNCALAPLGPAAINTAEREVLGASLRFVETYRRSVLNPAISPLSAGGVLPVRDPTGATRDANTEFLRSCDDLLFAPHEVLFISGELQPWAPRPDGVTTPPLSPFEHRST